MTRNILKIDNVKKTYRRYNLLGKEITKFPALNGLNLNLDKGQIYGFLGPNGAGKTTTIKCIVGILEADSGDIFIEGENIKDNQTFFKKKIGFLPEQVGLYGTLTANESLELYGGFYNLTDDEIRKRSKNLLSKLGLEKDANRKVNEYSLGMKKRLALSIALINEPELLVLDEPTSGLDPRGVKALRIVLKDLNKKGLTILLSSHVLSEVQEICTHVGIINEGKIIREESIKEITKEIEKKTIKLLLKVKNIKRETIDKLSKTNKIKNVKHNIDKKHDELIVDIKEENIPWVTDFLVNNETKIFSIEPKKNSLEDIFLKETGRQ